MCEFDAEVELKIFNFVVIAIFHVCENANITVCNWYYYYYAEHISR